MHNNFFEDVFSNELIMADFLKSHLPENIKTKLDFTNIKFKKDNYVDDVMKKLACDMLVSVRVKGSNKWIKCLIEHQSTPERWMALRIRSYINAILTYHVKTVKTEALPFIYPMVFFTGKRKWTHSIGLKEHMYPEIQEAFANRLEESIQLIDINRLDDKILDSHGMAGGIEKIFKYGPQCSIIVVLKCCKTDLKLYADETIKSILTYLLNVCPDGAKMANEAKKWCDENLQKKAGETMATLAENLRAEGAQWGREEGIQQGIQRGREEGIQLGEQRGIQLGQQRGIQRIVKSMLNRGHDAEAIKEFTGMPLEEIQALIEEETLAS